MTPKERKVIFTLIGIMFIVMVTVIVTKSAKKGKANSETQNKQNAEVQSMSGLMQGAVENNVNGDSTEDNVNNNTENTENNVNNNTENTVNNVSNNTENTAVTNNETNANNTNEVSNSARYGSLVFTNLKYENNNIGNKILIDVTNTGSVDSATKVAKLILTRGNGEKIECIITIPTINVGETKQLEHLLDEDASNIVGFNVEDI